MKTRSLLFESCLVVAALTFLNFSMPAQPVVSLELVDREAMETRIDQNAIFWAEFRVLRTGPVAQDLAVFLNTQQGSARLGEDYWLDRVDNGSTVRIPAGANAVNVRLYPIDDLFYEGDETAFFHLITPPPGAAPYAIDLAHSAVEMVIHDNDPETTRLDITSPRNGQQFQPGDVIELRASIIGPGSSNMWSVGFFDGDQPLGVTRPNAPIWWSDASGGAHVINARATNSEGTVLASIPAVTIQVGPGMELPVVKIGADPWRTGEPCPTCRIAPGVVIVERTAPTNTPLTVFLEIDGTATPGEDYEPLPVKVEIPAGQWSTQLTLFAIDDQLAEGPEVVRVRLLRQPPPLLPPTYFVSAHASEALLVIFDDEVNAPQARLDIVAPTNGAHEVFPSTVQLSAMAVNTGNEVYGPVEFYAGDHLVARSPVVATTRPPVAGLPSVHTGYWTNAPVGEYVLTACTRLSFGQSITSPPVKLTIDSPGLPVVRLETFPLENAQAPEFCPPNADCAYPSFVVRRTGPTNDDLRVYLSYSGTATADVDYPALPDSVVILAGRDAASLMLLPKDDTLIEGPETVVASFTAVPGHGYIQDPNHASATITILDNDRPQLTVVSIETVSRASEESSAPFRRLPLVGVFRISRTGPISNSLPVYVTCTGTAISGSDYNPLPFLVTIPEGTNSILVPVQVVVDHLTEGLETVVATISNCPPPGFDPPCFDFSINPAHAFATVFIRDDGLTEASLAITRPANGANFKAGETIQVQVIAIDLEGYISRVEFYDGNQLLGVSELFFLVAPPPGTPIDHGFDWYGAAPGAHVLTARAVRATGEQVQSPPVSITVDGGGNQAPAVAITQPANGANLPPNMPIEIIVQTRDPDGYVPTVKFFADGRKIGERNVVFFRPPDPGQTQILSFLWRTPTPGPHILTARAIDNLGDSAVSAPVGIQIAFEILPIVSVLATDSLAVEPASNSVSDTATFRLRRFGATNTPLTVVYTLHGTAQNGIDYQLLSGSAAIPSGSFITEVVVRPLPDQLAERIETVILRVEEQPQYRLGFRRRAVALISDAPATLSAKGALATWLPDGCFHASFTCPGGGDFRLEASADLLNWETVLTTTAVNGTLDFVEDETATFSSRFYRPAPEPVAGTND